ncbi:ParB/Sulfiredoxin [uncultured Caudovirales phage]|uniref:ParB/Sulfiredoxin n=1 Tax=uncultured Caudovirales phage TaxID=2100421 RepID=A0A6J7XGK5_9CAUD|nr:ParB/Sulfiredoxin [uncultured Caudovirales phage]CAB4184784.1 ParB/Sulfiredoxin [uncultured Caudovirales phage]CAB5230092.1 ParB/Sulfiredoxin [uncultured Caudovirales phage]
MKITQKKVTELIPYVNNSRTHSDEQVAQIAASIKEFGWTNPILVDGSNGIIAGHGRLLAARKLGFKEVPTIELADLTDTQRKAYIIADNRLALNAGWDNELLTIELNDLLADGFALEMLGFDPKELNALLVPEVIQGLTDEDAVPDVPEDPKTKLGDIYQLGNHRLMCGDSTSIDAVDKLMDGQKADMVFTSPPYNADAKVGQGDIFNGKKSVKLYAEGYSDKLPSSEYVDFAASVLEVCFAVTDGFIFWNVSYNAKSRFEYIQQISGRLPYLVEQICWKKSSTIPFKGSLMRDWEPIFLFSTNKQPVAVKEVTSNFWNISNTGAQTENHKACFPVALAEKGISIVANNTGLVFDPFGGSGSTLIACEKTSRINRSMELDPKYCDVIVKRWEDFTGKKAVLLTELAETA